MTPRRDFRTGKVRGQRDHPPVRWWRRKPKLLAGIASGLLLAVLGAWAVYFVGPSNGSNKILASSGSRPQDADGIPILVNVIHEGTQQHPINGAFAFPRPLKLSASELAAIDKSGLTAWAVPRGGYDVGDSLIKLTITATTDVRVLNMKAIVLSSTPVIHGTFFGIASQGFVPNTAVDISLASPTPVAMAVGSDGFPTRQPYFDRYSYDLARGQSATFEITAYTTRTLYGLYPDIAVRWNLQVTLVSNGRLHNVVVKDTGGVPFATTGSAAGNGRAFTQAYGAVYEQCFYSDFKVARCKSLPNLTWVRFK